MWVFSASGCRWLGAAGSLAVAEGAEDAGVVGGGGAQLEELALGGGDGLVEHAAQFVGVPVELGDGERPLGGRSGVRPGRVLGVGGGRALAGEVRAGGGELRAGGGQAEEFREAVLGGEDFGQGTPGSVRYTTGTVDPTGAPASGRWKQTVQSAASAGGTTSLYAPYARPLLSLRSCAASA